MSIVNYSVKILVLIFFSFLSYHLSLSPKTIYVTDESKYDLLIRDKQAVVAFSSNWCSACKGVKKPFEEVSTESEFDAVTFICINVDHVPKLGEKYGIIGVPTFVYLEKGNQKKQEIGVQNMQTFKDNLRNKLRQTFKVSDQKKSMPRIALLRPDNDSKIQQIASANQNGIFSYMRETATIVMVNIKKFFW